MAARRRWIRAATLAALFATSGAPTAGAASRTLTHETTKGRSCSVQVYATVADATTYGIASQRCDTKRGVRHVSGGSMLFAQNGRGLRGTAIADRSHLPFRLEGSYSDSEPGFYTANFSVVLRSPQTRRPERWRRRGVPRDCVIVATHHSRDTLACTVQEPVAAD